MADNTNDIKDNSAKSLKNSWIKGIFLKKKKSEENSSELKIDYPTTRIMQEPNFLMNIDLEQHSSKIEPELALWLNDGRIVKSIEELTKALKTMTGRIFNQHQENNELRDWVRDITGNAPLAAEIGAAKTKKDAIKALEKNIRESKKKKKAEPAENLEIQKAIEKIQDKPSFIEKSSPLDERERQLEEKERQLEIEESVLNKKRITLANRRYQLLNERGEIEKEKFEKILKSHYKEKRETDYAQGMAGMPETELTREYTSESIQQLINEARTELDRGDMTGAKRTITELKKAIECAAVEPREIKKLEYDVLELEADLKLAMLA